MSKVKDVKQHIEPVVMDLGGKERTFQFDMNAFAELEKRFGSIDAAMEKLSAGQISSVRTILWTALIHEEVEDFDEDTGEPIKYGITPYQVGSWIKNPMMLQQVSEKLGLAMSSGMPEPEEQKVLMELSEQAKADLEADRQEAKNSQEA